MSCAVLTESLELPLLITPLICFPKLFILCNWRVKWSPACLNYQDWTYTGLFIYFLSWSHGAKELFLFYSMRVGERTNLHQCIMFWIYFVHAHPSFHLAFLCCALMHLGSAHPGSTIYLGNECSPEEHQHLGSAHPRSTIYLGNECSPKEHHHLGSAHLRSTIYLGDECSPEEHRAAWACHSPDLWAKWIFLLYILPSIKYLTKTTWKWMKMYFL